MSPWDGASRWINTILLVVVGFVGFDTLFRLLEANERNVIVGFVRSLATVLLAPFEGMFGDQEYLLTALIAMLGYALVAGIAMAVIRSMQASRRRAASAAVVAPPAAETHEGARSEGGTQPLPQAPNGRDGNGAPGSWQRHVPDSEGQPQQPAPAGESTRESSEAPEGAPTERLQENAARASHAARHPSPDGNGGVRRS